MTAKLHIEGGDRRPIAIRDYMDLIDQYDYDSQEEVIEDAYNRGLELGELNTKNMLSTLSSLELLNDSDLQELTDLGEDLIEVSIYDSDLFFELLHWVYTTAYLRNPGPERLISWAYYESSKFLYQSAPIDSFSNRKQDIVDEIIYNAERSDGPGFEQDPGAFSTKSINGYQKFIEPLNPPVLEDNSFTLRSRVPEELVLLTIDMIYSSPIVIETTDYGDLLDLSDEVRKILGTVTFIDPQDIDDALEQTAAAYDYLNIQSDYRIRLRLIEPVELNDLT